MSNEFYYEGPCLIGDTVYLVEKAYKRSNKLRVRKLYVSAIHITDGVAYRGLKYEAYVVLRLSKGDRFSCRKPISEFGKSLYTSLDEVFNKFDKNLLVFDTPILYSFNGGTSND